MQKDFEALLAKADVKINGDRPWDITVHNPRFYQRALAGGLLSMGETYMDGWWDSKAIDQLIAKLITSKIDKDKEVRKLFARKMIFNILKAKITNMQSRSKAYEVGRKHYDIGNDLYGLMLDKGMNYSCGYWKNADNLDQAQEAKLDLICKKIDLKSGMKVLDIGCGWGGFTKFAAEKYGVEVVGITISKEQAKMAKEICEGLPVEIRLQDYRDLDPSTPLDSALGKPLGAGEKFDRIISIGMFEHVGPKNYKEYMKVVSRCLNPEGIFLLHTIGRNFSGEAMNPWIHKYIFPNGVLPSVKQIAQASEDFFVMEDWHNFGVDYDKTLMAWHENFNKNWDKIKSQYDNRFYRMWNLYLLFCAGSFRTRNIQLWQIVFSKNGILGGYKSIR